MSTVPLRSVTLQTDTDRVRAVAQPSIPARIRAIVPDHTAIVFKAPEYDNSWTWSTPQGLWAIYGGSDTARDRGPYDLILSGPGGSWTFRSGDPDRNLRELESVLLSLGAIAALPVAA